MGQPEIDLEDCFKKYEKMLNMNDFEFNTYEKVMKRAESIKFD